MTFAGPIDRGGCPARRGSGPARHGRPLDGVVKCLAVLSPEVVRARRAREREFSGLTGLEGIVDTRAGRAVRCGGIWRGTVGCGAERNQVLTRAEPIARKRHDVGRGRDLPSARIILRPVPIQTLQTLLVLPLSAVTSLGGGSIPI
jgi:hypothetical protein